MTVSRPYLGEESHWFGKTTSLGKRKDKVSWKEKEERGLTRKRSKRNDKIFWMKETENLKVLVQMQSTKIGKTANCSKKRFYWTLGKRRKRKILSPTFSFSFSFLQKILLKKEEKWQDLLNEMEKSSDQLSPRESCPLNIKAREKPMCAHSTQLNKSLIKHLDNQETLWNQIPVQ